MKPHAFALCFLTACGSLQIHRIGARGKPVQTTRIRFSRPKPFVLLSSGPQGCEAKIVFLPDPNEQYEITPGALGGDVAVTLKDGWQLVALGGKGAPGGNDGEASELQVTAEGVGGFEAAPLHVGLYELDLKTRGPVVQSKPIWDSGVECGQSE